MLLVGASASAREAAFIGGLSSPRLWNLDAAAAAATKAHSRDASSRPATLRTCRSRREAVGLAACSMSAMLPFVAAHGPSMIVTAKAAAVQAVALATGTWIGLVLWTLLNMAVYTVRRAYLHGLTKRLVLCRHFINGYDEPPHPYFAVAFSGWLLFLVAYIPMEICLYICARCSVFYYYYPMARGVGLMVERIAGCTTKIAAFTRDTEVKSKVSQRQIIRIDWHRFKICVSGLNSQNRYCGESVIVNLPHVDLPGHQIKHWPWEHVHALRDMIRRFHKIPLQQAAMDTAGLPGGGSGLVPTPKSKTPAPAHARKPRKKKNRPVDPRFAQGSRSASPRARNPSTSPRDKA